MPRARGFTLVEVLVAVAVLALALGAVISGMARYASNSGYLRQKTVALWVAHNRLTEFTLQPTWPEIGKSDGEVEMAGAKWQWRAEVKTTQDDQLRRIDLQVLVPGPGDKRPVLAALSSFIAQP